MSPTLYQADLRITNHRRQKSPPSFTLLSFKTRIQWPLGWPQPQVFRGYFSTPAIFKATSKLFGSQGCSYDKNWLEFFSIFFKIFKFRSSIKVPMKWNFRLLFYFKILKSMILWFVIFEFGLLTSAYEFFLELQSWPIRVKMCGIPRAVKICKLVRLTSLGV